MSKMSQRDLRHVMTALGRLADGGAGVGVRVEDVEQTIGRGRGDMRTPLNLQSLADDGLVVRQENGAWALTVAGLAWLEAA